MIYTKPNLGLDISLFHIKYELASLLIPNTKIFNASITIIDGNFISLYPRDKYF